MGGSKTDPGIFINWSLRLGTTASTCITFDKFWPISRDLVFDIRTLELWVVNEVIMKRTNVANRDFYSTVVMWNRLGKHKANVKERDIRITEHRDCCFNNGSSNFRRTTNCSIAEVHETEQRHFEPSHTSLTGTNTLDDELLIAIKNRLAGVPPMAGALNLKPEPSGERFNMHDQKSNRPQPYLVTSEPSKPKKVPTPVATQVDDSIITELKHQGTSTSHAKVKSTFTQSELDGAFTQRTDTTLLQHSSSRMKRDDEGYQRSSHLEQNTQAPELRHYSSRMNRVDEGFQRASHLQQNVQTYNQESTPSNMNQMDQQHSFPNQRRPSAPAQAVFPNYQRPSVQSHVADPNQRRPSVQSHVADPNQRRPSVQSQVAYPNPRRQSVQSQVLPHLPEVPNNYPVSGEPSISRSMRSGTVAESPMHQKIGELSRTDMQKNTAVLPYQHATNNAVSNPQGHKSVVDPQVRNSAFNPEMRNPVYNQQEQNLVFNPEEIIDQQSQPQLRSVRKEPSKSTVEDEALRTQPSPRVRMDPAYDGRPSVYSYEDTPSPPTSQLAIVTPQINNNQTCTCGSREINIECFCKKSMVKELLCATMEGNCRCAQGPQCETDKEIKRRKKQEKERRARLEREAKAEERRRKKVQQECERRAKKEQRAREKECRRRAKKEQRAREKECRNKIKSQYKEKKCKQSNARMCSCCKCRRHSSGEITCISHCTDESRAKKRRKAKKRPEEKKKKKTKCPPPIQTGCDCPPVANYSSSCRMSAMQNPCPVEVQGCCNYPESPCPALAQVPAACSKDNCGDPCCPYSKRNNCAQITAHKSNPCNQPKTNRDCSCQQDDSGCNTRVCALPAQIDPSPHLYSASPDSSNSPSPDRSISPNGNSLSNVRSNYSRASTGEGRVCRDLTAAPAIIMPNDIGRGDASEAFPFTGRWQSDPRFSPTPADNVIIDLSKRGREGSPNKRYVPPCVLYLDCTKVKDLCVIIKDKYEDPS